MAFASVLVYDGQAVVWTGEAGRALHKKIYRMAGLQGDQLPRIFKLTFSPEAQGYFSMFGLTKAFKMQSFFWQD